MSYPDEQVAKIFNQGVLHAVCQDFINKNKIDCEEVIYQTDWVIENAYKLIEDICEIVGYYEEEE